MDNHIKNLPKDIGKLIFKYVGPLDKTCQLIKNLRQSYYNSLNVLSLNLYEMLLSTEQNNDFPYSAWTFYALLSKYYRVFNTRLVISFNEVITFDGLIEFSLKITLYSNGQIIRSRYLM
jgi:hypothetical protein